MCSPSSGGGQRTGGVPVSKLRVRGSWETGVSSLLGPPDLPGQKPAALPGSAKDAPPGGPGLSCHQEEYVWRLTQLLGAAPPGRGELSPCSSDSICTEDFAARFQEAMVEALLPKEQEEERARARSPESLGGHISRLSQGSPPQSLSSRGHQQLPKEERSSLPGDPSPRSGPAAPGAAGPRSLPHLGGPFPEKRGHKRDSGVGPARSQSGGPKGPGLHTGSKNPLLPLPASPHDRRVHWAPEPSLNILRDGPAWEAPALRQLSRPLAGPQDPRLSLGRLPASPCNPGPLFPSCPLGYPSPSSQKQEPSLRHRQGLKKEQETPRDPKPWKWSNKLERGKDEEILKNREEWVAGGTRRAGKEEPRVSPQDGGPGQLGVTGTRNTRHRVAWADAGTRGRWQQLMPEPPASVEAPRPRSPGPGLKLLGALLEAARRRLRDVIQQAETLQEAMRELQRHRLASMPGGCQDPESSAAGQEYNVDGGAASSSGNGATERQNGLRAGSQGRAETCGPARPGQTPLSAPPAFA